MSRGDRVAGGLACTAFTARSLTGFLLGPDATAIQLQPASAPAIARATRSRVAERAAWVEGKLIVAGGPGSR